MKFNETNNHSYRRRRLNERVSTIDKVDRLYNDASIHWEDFIENTLFKKYPNANGLDEIPEYELEELLDDMKDEAIKRLKNGDTDLSVWELNYLDVKITPEIAYSIYRYRLGRRDDYSKGWADCYSLLDSSHII